NHFYDLWQKAHTKDDWGAWQFTTLEGGNVSAEEIETARVELDAKTFRQEYEARFENFEGRAYYAFDRNYNVVKVDYDASQPITWSLDFNYHPMCSVIGQLMADPIGWDDHAYRRRTMKFHILDEIHLPHSNTPEACETFHHRVQALVGGRQIQ